MQRQSPFNRKRVNYLSPVNINGAQIGGDRSFVSMRNYLKAECCLMVGAASSTPAVTLSQAKNVEGNGSKALAFLEVWKQMPGASPQEEGDLWQRVDVTSNTFDLAANTNYIIVVKADDLDVNNKFDCIRMEIAAEAGTNLVAGWYDLEHARYMGEGNTLMPSALVN